MELKIIVIAILISLVACKSNTDVPKKLSAGTQVDVVPVYQPGPHIYIYKTKSDYNNKVPITLSEDKQKVMSYPDPSDIVIADSYRQPTILKKGYLLDNIGIGKNTAFLKLSFEEYSKLKVAPSSEDLLKLVLEKDPFIEMYDCGLESAFTDKVEQLNLIIKANKLDVTFRKVL
jgi:hypothetical protein